MRNKLIKLLEIPCDGPEELGSCPMRKYGMCTELEKMDFCAIQHLADHLIANGVTFAGDVSDIRFGKWIPVSESMPELIPCTAGTAYSNAVNALTSGNKVITAIYDGEDFIGDARFWGAEDETITHWTPVLLPLPEPPKEG